MKVNVENNVYIESDERQFILKEYTGKFDKNSNEIFKVLGYFATVTQALRQCVKLNIMRTEAATLEELIADVKRIEDRIEEVIQKH